MRNIPPHLRPGNSFPQLYQIHNLFVFSTVGKLLVPFLRELGVNCTEPLSNQPQGIVSTLIFFENVYLELFWLEEKSDPTQFELTTEFNFIARANWLETGASPFGFSLCELTDSADLSTSTVEVRTEVRKTDRAPQSEPLLRFSPEKLAKLEEPICQIISNDVANRLNRVLALPEYILTQPLEMRKLTHVKLRVHSDQLFDHDIADHTLTTPLDNLANQNILDLEYRKTPLLELTFDDGNQARCLDLRPLIPIVFKY